MPMVLEFSPRKKRATTSTEWKILKVEKFVKHRDFQLKSWTKVVRSYRSARTASKVKEVIVMQKRSFAEGMFTGGTFAGRMVKPFKAFKRQQHSAAMGLLVFNKSKLLLRAAWFICLYFCLLNSQK